MFFLTITTPGLAINTYLIGDKNSKTCVVIDPPRLIGPILAAAQNAGLIITDILETHVHADFVSGSVELKNELKLKPLIHASGMGGQKWIPAYADKIVKDGDVIQLGSIHLKAIHTPGHTPEHLMWVCYDDHRSPETPWLAFSGDFLFVGGIGRPDLLGQDAKESLAGQLYHSLFTKMDAYPDFMEIFPCHAAGSLCGKFIEGRSSSTLGYERRFNPYFIKKPEKEWVDSIKQQFSHFPPQFSHIKTLNVNGPPLLETLTTLAAEGSIEDLDLEALFIIDTRMPHKFSESHLEGSLNIPMHDSFCQWCAWFVPAAIPLGIVVDDHHRDEQIVNQLRLIGYDQPILTISLPAHLKTHFQSDSYQLMTADAASHADNLCIVDVRTLSEWNSGHIPGAVHIELPDLEGELKKLPSDQKIATICRSGLRASIAASLLKKHGLENVSSIQGGMQAWAAAGLPVEAKN